MTGSLPPRRSTYATSHRSPANRRRRRADRPRRRPDLPLAPAVAATTTVDDPIPLPIADHCGGRCSDILPPGQNGNATLAQILLHKAFGTMPAHASDQLARYDSLVAGYPGLTDAKVNDFFNDASFGVPADQVESTTSPRPDVTITRDKKTGVPHIKGTTRYGTSFGAGYAAAQDRLWQMDLFRHVGRGDLTPFAGGALANQGLEQQFWPQAPYTEADLQAQVDRIRTTEGERGRLAMEDAQAYVDGINLYRTRSKDGRYFPGEYVLTGHIDSITNAGEIQPFKITDLIALASVVGGLFGGGGGGEVQAALSLLAAQQRYGLEEGTRVWESFRQRNDPEAVLTVHDGTSFPYAQKPANPQGTALPDAGSVVAEPLVYDRGGAATAPEAADPPKPVKQSMSNALLVSGAHTASGHPVAVFGPQTGYLAPNSSCSRSSRAPASAPAAPPSPASACTSSSAAVRTTRGAPPPPDRTSPTPSPWSCANRAVSPPPGPARTTSTAAPAPPWRSWSGPTPGRSPSPTRHPTAPTACRCGARTTAS